MKAERATALNIIFALLAALGILMVLFGIAVDFLPGSSPGLNLPQILLIAAGLLCSLTALALRSAHVRQNLRKHWRPSLVIAAATLIVLELVLAAAGIPTYFPPPMNTVPQPFYEPAPWWTCDEAGCHYVQEHIAAACESGHLAYDRECIINQRGFHDTQDFAAANDWDEQMRILMLGDSFTFGLSADIGKSYVETIESNFPQSIVWNTAMHGAGTNQALASFQVYAPILQPHLTIFGFSLNDFYDNLMPMDYRLMGIDWNSEPFRVLRYRIESSGNVIKFDRRWLYYDRHDGLDPPGSEIERLIGRTRIGSLPLRFFNVRRQRTNKTLRVPLTPAIIDATRRYLTALREAAAAQDTALLILLIPNRSDIDAPSIRYQTALRLAQELETSYIDPIHTFDVELDYAPPPDIHWNTAGHQKIGAILSDCLEVFQISHDLSDCESVNMP